ncbi:MAG: GNAT family N-acetyltransferase [Candidatus Eremiobacter antarcticus]|nr:GNAT family N-acetyltransferase [Candidatus Eremiobacteraeota bacterium]MBC5807184.1 GNAT family N-acetyltransferase [Candidatus Eremiobacteraeota bacterium]
MKAIDGSGLRALGCHICVRPLSTGDARSVRDGFASAAAALTTRYSFPRSLASVSAQLELERARGHAQRFAITADERLIGVCSLQPPLYSGKELTIAIFDAGFRGRGVGTHAVGAVCRYGFQVLKTHRIELGVYADNHAARACYRRCGFRYEARLRKFLYHDGGYRDILWMSLLPATRYIVVAGERRQNGTNRYRHELRSPM